MRIAISQPTYLPWCGYFDLIDQVDKFVVLDNVQFEKQSWQHRNRIKTPAGLQWLTVPVRFHGRFGQLIQEVEIRDIGFAGKHLRAIELNYRRAPFFEKYFPTLQRLVPCQVGSKLVDLNLRLLQWLCDALQLNVSFVRASALSATGKRTELLANICVELGATEYLSPIGSADYLLSEMELLTARDVAVSFQHYGHPQYRQLFSPFVPYACVLDLLFNEGPGALEIIRSGRRPALPPADLSLSHGAQAG